MLYCEIFKTFYSVCNVMITIFYSISRAIIREIFAKVMVILR